MAQDAVNRWWWPSLMMFGPPDKDSPNSAELLRWGVKRKSNDELRQRFVNLTVAAGARRSISRSPIPSFATTRRRENWTFGAIDWDEFWRVVKGDGPCNRERLAARRKAHDDGEWVRVAAAAYAAKHATAPSAA